MGRGAVSEIDLFAQVLGTKRGTDTEDELEREEYRDLTRPGETRQKINDVWHIIVRVGPYHRYTRRLNPCCGPVMGSVVGQAQRLVDTLISDPGVFSVSESWEPNQLTQLDPVTIKQLENRHCDEEGTLEVYSFSIPEKLWETKYKVKIENLRQKKFSGIFVM